VGVASLKWIRVVAAVSIKLPSTNSVAVPSGSPQLLKSPGSPGKPTRRVSRKKVKGPKPTKNAASQHAGPAATNHEGERSHYAPALDRTVSPSQPPRATRRTS
jgi:hypothetical protein